MTIVWRLHDKDNGKGGGERSECSMLRGRKGVIHERELNHPTQHLLEPRKERLKRASSKKVPRTVQSLNAHSELCMTGRESRRDEMRERGRKEERGKERREES